MARFVFTFARWTFLFHPTSCLVWGLCLVFLTVPGMQNEQPNVFHFHCLFNYNQNTRLIVRLIDWLTYAVDGWWTGRSTDWLIDWLIDWLHVHTAAVLFWPTFPDRIRWPVAISSHLFNQMIAVDGAKMDTFERKNKGTKSTPCRSGDKIMISCVCSGQNRQTRHNCSRPVGRGSECEAVYPVSTHSLHTIDFPMFPLLHYYGLFAQYYRARWSREPRDRRRWQSFKFLICPLHIQPGIKHMVPPGGATSKGLDSKCCVILKAGCMRPTERSIAYPASCSLVSRTQSTQGFNPVKITLWEAGGGQREKLASLNEKAWPRARSREIKEENRHSSCIEAASLTPYCGGFYFGIVHFYWDIFNGFIIGMSRCK